jgi:GH25 family lysozyme M1 (1,4-beta-N-acetylmuramidase)
MSLGDKLTERLYRMRYSAINWEVQGVDLSKWNGTMDLRITKTKAQYGKLRYGYGTQWKDPCLDNYYQQAQANDWPVGGYWFCQIGTDVNLSMRSFAEEIATHRPQVGITLDAEQTTVDPGKTLKWLEDAWQIILGLTNIKAEIYTAPWFWNPKVARSSFWSGKEHWCANWTTRDTPVLSLDWYSWIHWQYSGDNNGKGKEYGMVSGGDADMDLNRFNGTVAQFNSKYGTHIQPIGVIPPVVPPGTLPPYVIINTAELAIHSTPQAVQTNIIGHALQNTKWYPLEEVVSGISWYRLAKDAYISKSYCRYP